MPVVGKVESFVAGAGRMEALEHMDVNLATHY